MNSLIWSCLNWLKHHNSFAAAVSLKYRGALQNDGWFCSVRKNSPVDSAGNPIPWISYPALHFLEPRTRPEMAVLEFGSGYSTLWWARRVRRVVALECDREWHARLRKLVPNNVDLILGTTAEHQQFIARTPDTFDMVVIDDGDRVAAAEIATAALKQGGVILWDDSDRAEYRSGLERLAAKGFARIPFVGLGPVVNLTKETSILYRPGNILGI